MYQKQTLIGDPQSAPAPFKWIRKYACLKKVDWLIQERLNTRDPMKRDNFFAEYEKCFLCEEGTDETMMYFLSCAPS